MTLLTSFARFKRKPNTQHVGFSASSQCSFERIPSVKFQAAHVASACVVAACGDEGKTQFKSSAPVKKKPSSSSSSSHDGDETPHPWFRAHRRYQRPQSVLTDTRLYGRSASVPSLCDASGVQGRRFFQQRRNKYSLTVTCRNVLGT